MNLQALIGGAGTGKSTLLKSRLRANPKYAKLTATTGIAAVNLSEGLEGDGGITTVNSVLKFFNYESLKEAYADGSLIRNLAQVRVQAERLAIDEISMFSAGYLNILCKALEKVNDLKAIQDRGGLGLLVVGDFCQLAPITDKLIELTHPLNQYAFESRFWGEFEVERLTTIHRQSDPVFLQALQAARAGDGGLSGEILESLNVFTDNVDLDYDGVTIYGTNREVDLMNDVRLEALYDAGAKDVTLGNFRWGKERSEWKLIPKFFRAAIGAYVMILINDSEGARTGDMSFANGSCGVIKDYTGQNVTIAIERTGRVVVIPYVTRSVYVRDTPEGLVVPSYQTAKEFKNWKGRRIDEAAEGGPGGVKAEYKSYLQNLTQQYKYRLGIERPGPYFDFVKAQWVVGEIKYMPLRLAYASTVNKAQGLTLDRVQIDPYREFFGSPGMAYVAMSRVRGAEGLRIVGSKGLWEKRCNAAGEVQSWV